MKASVGNHKGKVKGQLHEQFFFQASIFLNKPLSNTAHYMYLKNLFKRWMLLMWCWWFLCVWLQMSITNCKLTMFLNLKNYDWQYLPIKSYMHTFIMTITAMIMIMMSDWSQKWDGRIKKEKSKPFHCYYHYKLFEKKRRTHDNNQQDNACPVVIQEKIIMFLFSWINRNTPGIKLIALLTVHWMNDQTESGVKWCSVHSTTPRLRKLLTKWGYLNRVLRWWSGLSHLISDQKV